MHKNEPQKCNKWAILSVLMAIFVLGTTEALAQNAIRINEVLLDNQTGYVDECGTRSAWIELYNPSAATVNVGGVFLSDDPSQPTKYPVRIGSRKSIVPPYQTFVIFLDGKAKQGVHHVDLTLDSTTTNTIYLYEEDGVTLIDQLTVPPMDADVSYARIPDGKGDFRMTTSATPDELNDYFHGNENIKNFQAYDPYGLVMTLIAVMTVFVALTILFFAFKWTGNFFSKKEAKPAGSAEPIKESKLRATSSKPEEVYAAIAMALHDTEDDSEQVAIALALYQSGLLDNKNSGMIQIMDNKRSTNWAKKANMMRQTPQRPNKR